MPPLAILLLFAACRHAGGGPQDAASPPAEPPPSGAEAAMSDLEPWDPTALPEPEPGDVNPRSLLSDAAAVATPVPLEAGGHALAWSTCDPEACRIHLGLLRNGAVEPLGELDLGATAWAVDGISFRHAARFDVDGDGKHEWVLVVGVNEPPRPVLGSYHRDLVVILGLPGAEVRWRQPLWEAGASTERACRWTLHHAPPQGDRPAVLEARGLCGPRSVIDVEGQPRGEAVEPVRRRWEAREDRWVRVDTDAP